MIDKQPLIDLAARCEAATGADRELDEAILCELFGMIPTEAPAYSASLDAAMTLLPSGAEWDRNRSGAFWVYAPLAEGWGTNVTAQGATPALALTAAALLARAEQEQPNDDR